MKFVYECVLNLEAIFIFAAKFTELKTDEIISNQ